MKLTFRHRVQYAFDNLMARGTPALIGMLFVLSLGLVVIAAVIISVTGFAEEGETSLSFPEAAWDSLLRTLDPGTMGGDTGQAFRTVMLFVTIGGIFVVSTLIGVLDNDLQTRIEELRKGRSLVLESGHTLILGWSTQIFTILNELMIANENQPKGRLVILAERDKMEMEDRIRARVTQRGKTRIICRSGNPLDPGDLAIVSPATARAIIILPPQKSGYPDTDVIKTVLAIINHPDRKPAPYTIITQVQDPKSLEVLKIIGKHDRIVPIHTCDFVARIIAQTARQSGLSIVYTELMDFKGDEVYFQNEPKLFNKTYGETLLAYEDSCVLGLRNSSGEVFLNPPMDTRIGSGDAIIALSEDDDTVRVSNLTSIPIDESAIHHNSHIKPKPEKCLVLGWNDKCAAILRELDTYIAKGSEVTVVANVDGIEEEIRTQLKTTKNEKLTVIYGDTTNRELLDSLKLHEHDHVIVLPYGGLGVQEADAKTLVTLLHLRDIANHNDKPFSIVSEMLDLRNRDLASSTRVDDFIVSEQLLSFMLAQFSENVELFDVFAEIFDPEGCEIYLKPMSNYVETAHPTNFYTVVQAARLREETAIGYRLAAEKDFSQKSYGIHTNPKKSELVSFNMADKIIVISEN